ncbi:MAG: hypothetical protein HFJ52_04225 [Clostridia bacterium]|nr:hypothetical protein [Clostridia bacterium]
MKNGKKYISPQKKKSRRKKELTGEPMANFLLQIRAISLLLLAIARFFMIEYTET